jgi:hypothetical protein
MKKIDKFLFWYGLAFGLLISILPNILISSFYSFINVFYRNNLNIIISISVIMFLVSTIFIFCLIFLIKNKLKVILKIK